MMLKLPLSLVCFHWCCLHEWLWMWYLKVAYESIVSRSYEFVELIIMSGTSKVCDSIPWDQLCCYFYPVLLVCVIHKREFIMHSIIRFTFTFMHLADAFIQSDLVHSGYTYFISMCVPWELNPQPFSLLMQCSTTEPQEQMADFGTI